MDNELDRIYADYKKGIKPGQSQRQLPQHERRLDRIGLTHGVPDPIFQSEMEQDNSNVLSCSKCGSMSVSLDMSTNKMTCNDCKNNDKPSKVNFEKQMTDMRETEMRDIENRMKMGEQFFS